MDVVVPRSISLLGGLEDKSKSDSRHVLAEVCLEHGLDVLLGKSLGLLLNVVLTVGRRIRGRWGHSR